MDISFIIVNFNTRELLRECLKSILATVEDLAYEVFVVDNGSTDGSVEMVRAEFPTVQLIANSQNRGFAAANNQALRLMAGRYAFLLNSDAYLTPQAVKELFQFMEDHPEAAMAGGQLLNRDGSKQRSFASFPTLLTLLLNETLLEYLFPRKYPGKRHCYKGPLEVDSLIGAAMMVRKKAIEEVGVLDERYFFFFEETDWAHAMRKAGWKIYHVPTAFIYHFQGSSIGKAWEPRYEFYRSRYLYFRKWYSPWYGASVRFVIKARLLVNFLSNSLFTLLTLGLLPSIRQRALRYGKLIRWHFEKEA